MYAAIIISLLKGYINDQQLDKLHYCVNDHIFLTADHFVVQAVTNFVVIEAINHLRTYS